MSVKRDRSDYMRRYRLRNLERIRAYNRRYYWEHREQRLAYSRSYREEKKAGMTEEERLKLFKENH